MVCFRGILTAVKAPKPWTRYAIVNRRLMNWTLPLTLPVRWVDKAMGDTFGLTLIKRPDKQKSPSAPEGQ